MAIHPRNRSKDLPPRPKDPFVGGMGPVIAWAWEQTTQLGTKTYPANESTMMQQRLLRELIRTMPSVHRHSAARLARVVFDGLGTAEAPQNGFVSQYIHGLVEALQMKLERFYSERPSVYVIRIFGQECVPDFGIEKGRGYLAAVIPTLGDLTLTAPKETNDQYTPFTWLDGRQLPVCLEWRPSAPVSSDRVLVYTDLRRYRPPRIMSCPSPLQPRRSLTEEMFSRAVERFPEGVRWNGHLLRLDRWAFTDSEDGRDDYFTAFGAVVDYYDVVATNKSVYEPIGNDLLLWQAIDKASRLGALSQLGNPLALNALFCLQDGDTWYMAVARRGSRLGENWGQYCTSVSGNVVALLQEEERINELVLEPCSSASMPGELAERLLPSEDSPDSVSLWKLNILSALRALVEKELGQDVADLVTESNVGFVGYGVGARYGYAALGCNITLSMSREAFSEVSRNRNRHDATELEYVPLTVPDVVRFLDKWDGLRRVPFLEVSSALALQFVANERIHTMY